MRGDITGATRDLARWVAGAVTTPRTYTPADLAALPQQSFTVGQRTDTGVSLENLVNTAAPVLPNAKNALLRVTVTVTGAGFPVTFALGELDPDSSATTRRTWRSAAARAPCAAPS